MLTTRDILRANCPNDTFGKYSLHRIELHCSWYCAITEGDDIIFESLTQLLQDEQAEKVLEEWTKIRGNLFERIM